MNAAKNDNLISHIQHQFIEWESKRILQAEIYRQSNSR